ncbi:DNA primase [Streptomyces sp. NPDC052682]|uniref:DNA primase n=1 Tax=Streptomyces sp. NPDC052682 TaxID=3154954 RepID=UPI0034151228
MNRMGLGLAIGAGYLLGRTKKLKAALAVGSFVAGKKMNLTPKGVADLVSQQLRNNPQFKEIGDQLRQDLRGVGKAASGAMVERQIDALADRLHGRTAQVRERLSGAAGVGSRDSEDAGDEEPEDREPQDAEGEAADADESEESGESGKETAQARKAPGKDTAEKAASKTAKKAPAKKAAKKAPAKKAAPAGKAAKKTAAGKAPGKKATAAAGGARDRQPKGGGER